MWQKLISFQEQRRTLPLVTYNLRQDRHFIIADYDISIEALGEDYEMLKNRNEVEGGIRGYYPNILHQELQKKHEGFKSSDQKIQRWTGLISW